LVIKRAADGHLLALAARQLAGRLAALFLQDREQVEHLFHGARCRRRGEGPHLEVFFHRHGGEHVAGLRHEGHALAHAGLRGQPR
jgi:hypothetical protein